MSYVLEPISNELWGQLSTSFEQLSKIRSIPSTMVANRSEGNFLIETGNSTDRGDLFLSCVFLTQHRLVNVSISAPYGGNKPRLDWKAWNSITNEELLYFDPQILAAAKVLYPTIAEGLTCFISNYPIRLRQEDEVIHEIDLKVNLTHGYLFTQLLRNRTNELTNSKTSFFRWKFHLARLKRNPIRADADQDTAKQFEALIGDNHELKTLLVMRLEKGGIGFSEDTERVLRILFKQRGIRVRKFAKNE